MRIFLYSILVCLLLFFVAVATMWFEYYDRPEVDTSPAANEYYSATEFSAISAEFHSLVINQNPRVALLEAERRAKEDSVFSNSCHALAHHIGHAAYEKYQDFGVVMQYAEPSCNVGYVHGVSQAHFQSNQDITAELLSVCSNYSVDTSLGWECVHGIGHGLMLATQNSVPASLEHCDTFADETKRYACQTGLFMENFNTNSMFHPSDFLEEENPFQMCSSLEERYQEPCNHYAVHYYIRSRENNFHAGLERCAGLAEAASISCARGVGDLAIKEHIHSPNEVERLCMSAETSPMQYACISGMTALFTNQYGNKNDGWDLCQQLTTSSNAKTCQRVVENIPDDFYTTYDHGNI